jgi:hypothetical protein
MAPPDTYLLVKMRLNITIHVVAMYEEDELVNEMVIMYFSAMNILMMMIVQEIIIGKWLMT